VTTKIEKSGLLPVVVDLVERNPNISDQKIANILVRDYGDKLENGTLTWFAVHNVRKKLDTSNILKNTDDETVLSDLALREFRNIMADGAKKAEDIYKEAKSNGELGIALKGLDQIRKNWVSMMDYYKKHIIPPIQNVTINEDKKVIIYMQKYTELLCPNCKERINRQLILENDE